MARFITVEFTPRPFGAGLEVTWSKHQLVEVEGPQDDLAHFRDHLRALADQIEEVLNQEGLPPE
jgi:hypothetical protein